jgi:hypothetical protein
VKKLKENKGNFLKQDDPLLVILWIVFVRANYNNTQLPHAVGRIDLRDRHFHVMVDIPNETSVSLVKCLQVLTEEKEEEKSKEESKDQKKRESNTCEGQSHGPTKQHHDD